MTIIFIQRSHTCSAGMGWKGINCAVYSLGGDTAAPSGLYARLCHTFLVGSSLLVLARW